MSIARYRIAGLNVELETLFELTRSRAEKYRFDFEGKPDIVMKPGLEKCRKLREYLPDLNDEYCEYLMTGSGFAHFAIPFGCFMLHSSAISFGGKAYLFSADSGTGKSTHTGLWREYLGEKVTVINDDKPMLREIDGIFYANGTPWSGKNDDSTDVTVPVGAIAFVERAEEPFFEKADSLFAVKNLIRQTELPSNHELNDKTTELVDKIVKKLPVFRLGCDISEQSVKVAFEAMTGEKYKGKAL